MVDLLFLNKLFYKFIEKTVQRMRIILVYNSNTNSLIIVGVSSAHLMEKKKKHLTKKKGIICNSFPWLIWFILSKNLAFIYLLNFFNVKIWVGRLDPPRTQ